MRKLKMGIVGGGGDALIGAVHRSAAPMDGEIEFVAGAPSSRRGESARLRARLRTPRRPQLQKLAGDAGE